MNIDTEHLHHWMNAVRISSDPIRTLDAFWSGQIKSKEWLVDQLSKCIPASPTVEIYGGWVGVLASMLFQTTNLNIRNIINIDIDPMCKPLAEEMNRIEYHQGRFIANTMNMCDCYPVSDIVINTSCEHITQNQYDQWFNRIGTNQLLVLQSNDYSILEHVRTAHSLDEFKTQCNLSKIYYAGELALAKYKRFMLIGCK